MKSKDIKIIELVDKEETKDKIQTSSSYDSQNLQLNFDKSKRDVEESVTVNLPEGTTKLNINFKKKRLEIKGKKDMSLLQGDINTSGVESIKIKNTKLDGNIIISGPTNKIRLENSEITGEISNPGAIDEFVTQECVIENVKMSEVKTMSINNTDITNFKVDGSLKIIKLFKSNIQSSMISNNFKLINSEKSNINCEVTLESGDDFKSVESVIDSISSTGIKNISVVKESTLNSTCNVKQGDSVYLEGVKITNLNVSGYKVFSSENITTDATTIDVSERVNISNSTISGINPISGIEVVGVIESDIDPTLDISNINLHCISNTNIDGSLKLDSAGPTVIRGTTVTGDLMISNSEGVDQQALSDDQFKGNVVKTDIDGMISVDTVSKGIGFFKVTSVDEIDGATIGTKMLIQECDHDRVILENCPELEINKTKLQSYSMDTTTPTSGPQYTGIASEFTSVSTVIGTENKAMSGTHVLAGIPVPAASGSGIQPVMIQP